MLVDEGRQYWLDILTGVTSPDSLVMGLYTNAVTGSHTTTFSDITEPTESGYAQQTPAWNPATINGSGQGQSTAPSVQFDNTDSTDIVAVGFFYLIPGLGVLLAGNAFPTPLTIPATTGSMQITPKLLDNTI